MMTGRRQLFCEFPLVMVNHDVRHRRSIDFLRSHVVAGGTVRARVRIPEIDAPSAEYVVEQ